jgi:hypothetical protein
MQLTSRTIQPVPICRHVAMTIALLAPSFAMAAPPAVTAIAYDPKGNWVACATHSEVTLFDPATRQAHSVI